jgi:hypothetical protein
LTETEAPVEPESVTVKVAVWPSVTKRSSMERLGCEPPHGPREIWGVPAGQGFWLNWNWPAEVKVTRTGGCERVPRSTWTRSMFGSPKNAVSYSQECPSPCM